MDARSYESPMDWEYQDTGPCDPTSPFTHAARGASQTTFSSPSKASSRPNPFVNLGSPSKPQPAFTQDFRFTSQIPSKNAASPFRNPAFTTPRRPHDETVLSEVSGAEDSPALTEASDVPNDTPEADHRVGMVMSGNIAPLKIDKTHRYGKTGPFSKKHIAGKGEIKRHTEASTGTRKRKRHNHDRDVGTGVGRQSFHREAQDTESDDSSTSRNRNAESQRRGILSSLFHVLDQHPNTPDNLSRWIQLMVNFFLVSGCIYVSWSVVQTARRDIRNANDAAQLELMRKMSDCQSHYTVNECSKNSAPALQAMCDKWHDCMMQNPESIMRIKATAKHVAEIINEFSEAMNLKAWTFFAVVIFCASASNLMPGRLVGNKATRTTTPQPMSSAHDEATRTDSTPGYMLVPVQTPKTQRYEMLDEGTDTDTSPLNRRPTLSYYTPSGRRNLSRKEQLQSPVKYIYSPTKG